MSGVLAQEQGAAAGPAESELVSALRSSTALRAPAAAPRILAREPAHLGGTFRSEIVTCSVGGHRLRLLCKADGGRAHPSHGHRGGVPYEANVYAHVLSALGVSTPRLYGWSDGLDSPAWLLIEYLDDAVGLSKADERVAMPAAARWIGAFHRRAERPPAGVPTRSLRRYDAGYYAGWARRTATLASSLSQRPAWLPALARRFEALGEELAGRKPTIIHGEFYPSNILFRRGAVYPVDWEAAALAVGEIDLAMLTERWPPETVAACVAEYGSARWPQGVPDRFAHDLDAARLYVLFRWLGDRGEWTAHDRSADRLQELRSVGERLGLL